ncbi:PREDICTED: serine protease inhibitor 42Dd-like isoform X4 [Bactrocera latifrons]|uniref:serine protease inhibitor 42Dd-like isoform X4 n=1 Tax=Bactrocera latifrons TaxID=174628 RepID=UPI0008DD1551|nr:PREDICTED: serine protease inhibitor 42Dd-like isoform X4 [Bactrocera latifrons]
MLMSFIGRKIVDAKNLLALWSPLSRRGNNCNFDTFLTFVLLLSVYTTTATMSNHDQIVAQREFASKSAQFAVKLFNHMHKKDPNKNIIYSPFSIQTCVGMARIGAVGETAAELDRALGLPSNDVAAIADTFHNVLVTYKDSPILKVANKIFVMQGYSIKKEFNEIATTKFYSSADSINFADSANAANTINKWVESKTNNLIKNLIVPDAVNSDTRMVLVNAIHFKGEWKYQFPKSATRDDDFYLNEVDSVRVPMMNLKESFGYGVISELDATVLEMPYKDSDLSMLVILPNLRTGLASLQEKLKNFNLSDITRYLINTKVIVKMPKFKAEYNIELNDALINLGMARMFSNDAEFSNMLDSTEPLQVSKVVHKAFIEVNEEGTEAAAATAIFVGFSGPALPKQPPRKFIADRPFVFLIKNKANFVIFAGQKARR